MLSFLGGKILGGLGGGVAGLKDSASANALFQAISSGAIQIDVNQSYALYDARKAHEDLEARKTTGSTILVPEH